MDTRKETHPINRVADRYLKRVSQIFRTSFAAATRSIALGEIVSDAKRHDRLAIQASVAVAIESQKEILAIQLAPMLLRVLVAGGNAEARELDAALKRLASKIRFDKSSETACEWATQNAGELIVEITRETQESVRVVMNTAFKDQGIPPAQTARLIRESVGLDSKRAESLLKLRQRLIENPGKRVYAGKTPIRVPKTGITDDRMDRALQAYGQRLRNARAITIARTETIRAANEGQRQLWLQQKAKGNLSDRSRRQWITAFNPCPICSGLSGQTADLDGLFAGTYSGPPAHPRCRCTQGLVFARVKRSSSLTKLRYHRPNEFTEHDVRSIRASAVKDESIAAYYGVSVSYIQQIRNNDIWRDAS